jgi:hypothetical protein
MSEQSPEGQGTEPDEQPGFRESFEAAIRRSGFGQVAPGEVPTAGSLLKAVGGVRGLVESLLPGLGFLVVYPTTHDLPLSVLIPLALGIVFIVIRLATRTSVVPALSGVVLLAISAVLALVTGKADTNFVPGMVINAICLVVILISLIARWPIIGIIVGFLTNEPTAWRAEPAKRRVLFVATWLWALLFVIRLVVEVPLYLAHQTTLLAGARLVTGVPLYAVFLWITWLLVRTVYARSAVDAAEKG